MKTKIGHRFDGQIIGFSKKVAFIRLYSPFLEVSVPLSTIGAIFLVDQHNIKACIQDMNITLSIGDKVNVEITGIDENLRRVNAFITELSTQQNNKTKTIRFASAITTSTSMGETNFVQNIPFRFKSKTKSKKDYKKNITSVKNHSPSKRKASITASTNLCTKSHLTKNAKKKHTNYNKP